MTEQQPQSTSPQVADSGLAALSLEELELEIAQAQALVQDLNERLKLTADDSR